MSASQTAAMDGLTDCRVPLNPPRTRQANRHPATADIARPAANYGCDRDPAWSPVHNDSAASWQRRRHRSSGTT
ncbi:hypothetical protein OEM_49120 [Mycobacterium intracellulare subsp. yongonense 05-1390]|nr:hypothetical protein OEM_49120 [Mycobacterium intracellulare subsp. yongonense 05-1390]